MLPTHDHPHYHIRLHIEPPNHLLRIQGSLRLPRLEEGPAPDTPLSFYLHRQFTIESLTGDWLADWHFDTDTPVPIRWLPTSGVLSLNWDSSALTKAPLEFQFAYQGRITEVAEWSANTIGPEWTEIGLYLPWYPSHPSLGMFTFDVEVECDPAYQITSYGEISHHADVRRLSWHRPTTDIVLTFSKTMTQRTFPAGDFNVHLNSQTLGEESAKRIGRDLTDILNTLQRWFGPGPGGDVTVTQSPREKGGGYTRRGLVILAGLDDETYTEKREPYARYLGHELAHLWWWRADTATWQDWLNESFAEYSALRIVKEQCGQASFEKRLANKAEALPGLPPIQGFNPGDCDTEEKLAIIQHLFYDKGPILLHQLAEKIGFETFLSLCQAMREKQIAETAAFLDLLEDHTGTAIRDWMGAQLQT
jgi:hypothetical protein